jgi:hypothetical protein
MFTDVGFHDNGTAIMVTFGFSKDTDGSFNLTVPFITMVHIPALEVRCGVVVVEPSRGA